MAKETNSFLSHMVGNPTLRRGIRKLLQEVASLQHCERSLRRDGHDTLQGVKPMNLLVAPKRVTQMWML